MKLQAVFDSIIVKPKEREENYGSIIVPDMGKEKHILGEIISVGPGRRSILSGDMIPTILKEGDIVMLPQMGITTLSTPDGDLIGCSEDKVLAIIKEEI